MSLVRRLRLTFYYRRGRTRATQTAEYASDTAYRDCRPAFLAGQRRLAQVEL